MMIERGTCLCGGRWEGYPGPERDRPDDLIHRGGNDFQCPRCFGLWVPTPPQEKSNEDTKN